MIHEHSIAILRDRLGTSGIFFFAWVIPGLIAVAVLAVLFGRFVFHLPAPVRGLVFAAAALYLAGALGLEMAGGWWAEREGQTNLTYMTITSIEEWFEFIGAATFFLAMLLLLRDQRSRILISVSEDRSPGRRC